MHAYFIVGGIVLGVLLSPGLLGRYAPDLHDDIFAGEKLDNVQAALQAHRDQTTEQLDALQETGVSMDAVQDHLAERKQGEDAIIRAAVREKMLGTAPWLVGLSLVIVALMVLESVFGVAFNGSRKARVPWGAGVLASLRYLAGGLLVMFVLAQPSVLWSLGWVGAAAAISAVLVGLVLLVIVNAAGNTHICLETGPADDPPIPADTTANQ